MSTRSALIRAMPCVACEIEGTGQYFPTEEHHLNKDGKAGRERRGDNFSIPLCVWHHRGVAYPYTARLATSVWGPSLAKQSRAFRMRYGTDDQLLAKTNERLRLAA